MCTMACMGKSEDDFWESNLVHQVCWQAPNLTSQAPKWCLWMEIKIFVWGVLFCCFIYLFGFALFFRKTRSLSVACTGIELTLVILSQPPRTRIRVCVTVPGCPLNEASQFLTETHFWLQNLFTKTCTLQVCILTLSCPLCSYQPLERIATFVICHPKTWTHSLADWGYIDDRTATGEN